MANPTFKRIKDLSSEKTSVADNDWFVLEDSADGFVTKKVKGQYLGANIYKNNGTLTGNRTVTHAGYTLTFGGTTRVVSPSASLIDTAFGVRNSTDTGWILRQRGDAGFFVYNNAGTYSMSYSDLGNGIPEFVLDCASGGQSIFHFRNNGTDSAVYKTIGTALWQQMRELQWRSFTTNDIQMVRDIEGRYLFCNDSTGLDTPDSNTRVKIASDGLTHALSTDARVKMANLQTFADNATAVASLGTNELYIRTGHGLDITV
jgi:hypothetical protein